MGIKIENVSQVTLYYIRAEEKHRVLPAAWFVNAWGEIRFLLIAWVRCRHAALRLDKLRYLHHTACMVTGGEVARQMRLRRSSKMVLVVRPLL